ncbi:MAG: hypothetical protein WC891_01300 [Actinomycetota bacterium]
MKRILSAFVIGSLLLAATAASVYVVNKRWAKATRIGADVDAPDMRWSVRDHKLTQTFRARERYIDSININVAQGTLPESGRLRLRLYRIVGVRGNSFETKEVALSNNWFKQDSRLSGWYSASFDPVRLDIAKDYLFSVELVGAKPGENPKWQANKTNEYIGGTGYIDGKRLPVIKGQYSADYIFKVQYIVSLKDLFVSFLKGETFYKTTLSPALILLTFVVLAYVLAWLLNEMFIRRPDEESQGSSD